MGRNSLKGLAVVHPGAVFLCIGIIGGSLGSLGLYPEGTENTPEIFPKCGNLTETLCNNVTGTLKGIINTCNLVPHEGLGLGGGIMALERPYLICQRLKPGLLGYGSPGAPLWPVWQVEVLKLRRLQAIFYPCL